MVWEPQVSDQTNSIESSWQGKYVDDSAKEQKPEHVVIQECHVPHPTTDKLNKATEIDDMMNFHVVKNGCSRKAHRNKNQLRKYN